MATKFLQNTTSMLNQVLAAEMIVSTKTRAVSRLAQKTANLSFGQLVKTHCYKIWDITSMLMDIISDTKNYSEAFFVEFINLSNAAELGQQEQDDLEIAIFDLLRSHEKLVAVIVRQLGTMDSEQVSINIPSLLKGIIEEHKVLADQLLDFLATL